MGITEYTNHLEKITLEDCSFDSKIEDISPQYMQVEHLILRSVKMSRDNRSILLPYYRNLKKLELIKMWIPSHMLTQTFQNNPSLESLTLRTIPTTIS